MTDASSTKAPSDDAFRGADELLRLSQRLMDWYEEPVSDEEVAAAVGIDLVPAFRYAQTALHGKVRKVTLEPAFCHSADVAFRAVELGYPAHTLMACFLHDVVEDTCQSIADVPRGLAELASRFPPEVVEEVRLLTNRYQLIFESLVPKLRKDLPFEARTARALRGALDALRYELPAPVADQFTQEFDQLAAFFDGDIDWSDGARISRRDKSFRIARYVGRKVYQLYVEDLARQAVQTTRGSGDGQPVTALVVKMIDLTDNIRTSEISNRLALYKLVNKAESLLDCVQSAFLDQVPAQLAERTTLSELHRLVQLRLVDQFERRRKAISNHFSETRFASLLSFLAVQLERLTEKYQIPTDRMSEVEAVENALRAINRRQ